MKDSRYEPEGCRPHNGYGVFVVKVLGISLCGFLIGMLALHMHEKWPALWFPLGLLATMGWSFSALALLLIILATFVHVKNCLTLRRIRRHGIESLDQHTSIISNKPTNQKRKAMKRSLFFFAAATAAALAGLTACNKDLTPDVVLPQNQEELGTLSFEIMPAEDVAVTKAVSAYTTAPSRKTTPRGVLRTSFQ